VPGVRPAVVVNTLYARPVAAAAMDMDGGDPPVADLRSSQDANAIDAEDRSSLVPEVLVFL